MLLLNVLALSMLNGSDHLGLKMICNGLESISVRFEWTAYIWIRIEFTPIESNQVWSGRQIWILDQQWVGADFI